MLTLLRWWFIFCAACFGAAIAGSLGFYGYLLKADSSHLGFVTLALFVLSSLWVGQMTFHARHGRQTFQRHLPICWYMSEAMMGLGMIGTLTGFLLLLGNALGQPINTADTNAMTALISKMGVGFSTAAVTTLLGLVCSLLFKLQLINLEYLQKQEEEVPFADTEPA
jgi:hypothetical protein